jgi:serine/threonine protein kinase
MFSENYAVCLNDDGSPREIERDGPVVTYKAAGYESGRMVAMRLIPLANIDEPERVRFAEAARKVQKLDRDNLIRVFDVGVKHDHFAFVSEYVEGEAADSWIHAHGPMPADAVLRIGLQVADALAAAASHKWAHGSIQPANILILPGVAADGGWPRIKLRNFDLAGLKFRSDENEARELVPPMLPEFSSPEQLENGIVDFRSDVFSLGATVWFLLTGAAPSRVLGTEPGARLLTPGPNVPRFVRNLVGRMLRQNPEERPQEPVALVEKIRACLQKAERQTAFTRSFAPAAIPTLPPPRKRTAPALALAASVAILAALAALLLWRSSQRESKPLGVIIGVPETVESSLASTPPSTSSLAQSAVNEKSEVDSVGHQPNTAGTSPPEAAVNADKLGSSAQLVANNHMAEPPTPGEGPSTETNQASSDAQPPPLENGEPLPADSPDRSETAANNSSLRITTGNEPPTSSERAVNKKRTNSTATKTTSRRQRLAKSSGARRLPPLRVGSEAARFVSTTSHGDWVLRLPSGETIVTPPVPNPDEVPVVSHRRVRRVERPVPLEDEPPVMVSPPQ